VVEAQPPEVENGGQQQTLQWELWRIWQGQLHHFDDPACASHFGDSAVWMASLQRTAKRR
jgi:hypothetical protein